MNNMSLGAVFLNWDELKRLVHEHDDKAGQIIRIEEFRAEPKPNGHGKVKRKPRTEAEMRCRHPGCRQRSKGPRFHYLCEKHLAPSKRKP